MTKSAPRGCSRPATISNTRLTRTLNPVSSKHSRAAASAGSSLPLMNPAGKVHMPRKGSLERRTSSTRPSLIIKTAAATFGSTKWIQPHCGQTSRMAPNRCSRITAVPQRGQKLKSEFAISIILSHKEKIRQQAVGFSGSLFLAPAGHRQFPHQEHEQEPAHCNDHQPDLPCRGNQWQWTLRFILKLKLIWNGGIFRRSSILGCGSIHDPR